MSRRDATDLLYIYDDVSLYRMLRTRAWPDGVALTTGDQDLIEQELSQRISRRPQLHENPEPAEEPRDARSGVGRYMKFHSFEPRSTGSFDPRLTIPADIGVGGKALFTTYRSDKWHPGRQENYVHEHEGGVVVYRPALHSSRAKVPSRFRTVETLVLLGKCLGVAYVDTDGDEVLGKSGGELYCTPDGHALVIITDKRKLEAMIWGGKLRVLDRGIVG